MFDCSVDFDQGVAVVLDVLEAVLLCRYLSMSFVDVWSAIEAPALRAPVDAEGQPGHTEAADSFTRSDA